MIDLQYEDQTYELRGLIYKVRNELKAGWPEEIYHQALVRLLQEKDIPALSKPRRSLFHRAIEVHLFEPDIIVSNQIILELKVLPFNTDFAAAHYVQLINYLKFFGKNLGMLVNFAPTRVRIKRVLWNEPELDILEDYEKIKPDLSNRDRQNLRQVRKQILHIAKQYGLGYPEHVYRKIVAIEIVHHGLKCSTEVAVPARWNEVVLAHHHTEKLLVADSYLIHIRSLLHHPTAYDYIQTKTYLEALGLNIGLVVNFGRRQLQIYGINAG